MTHFRSLTPSSLSRDAFVNAFADVYEHSPWVAENAFDLSLARGQHSDIDDIEALHRLMCESLMSADHARQLALINAHPDLAGRAAIQGQLTQASTREQAGAGIQHCTPAEFERFSELNAAYKTRFAFPFIMAVKGSDRHQILAAFERRIHHTADVEFNFALAEINTIALFRLQAL